MVSRATKRSVREELASLDFASDRVKRGEREWYVDPEGDEPGEFRCPDCDSRCTRTVAGPEVGHRKGTDPDYDRCERRPWRLDRFTQKAGPTRADAPEWLRDDPKP